MSRAAMRMALALAAAAVGSVGGAVVVPREPAGYRPVGLSARRSSKRRQRLPIATGPGSISAKSEVTRLVRAGRFDKAAAYAKQHREACGEELRISRRTIVELMVDGAMP